MVHTAVETTSVKTLGDKKNAKNVKNVKNKIKTFKTRWKRSSSVYAK